MRLIDADAFSAFIKKTVHEQGYDGDGALRICDALTIGDVLNSVCAKLDGTALEGFKNAPTVDAVPVRRGRWIRDEFGSRCERCGLYAYRNKSGRPWESDYCPYCGADMRGRQEGEKK